MRTSPCSRATTYPGWGERNSKGKVHKPLRPSELPLTRPKDDKRIAGDTAWRCKCEFGWPVVSCHTDDLDLYLDKKPFRFDEFTCDANMPTFEDVAPSHVKNSSTAQRFIREHGLALMTSAPRASDVANDHVDSKFNSDPCFQHLLVVIEEYRATMWKYDLIRFHHDPQACLDTRQRKTYRF